jgi:ribosomal protein S18 acetylase RimI-like enzyme
MPQQVEDTAKRPVQVRPARKADATNLAAFFMQAWKESGPNSLGFTGATDESMKEIASEGFLVQRLASPKVRIVVAEGERRILGFASLRFMGQGKAELSGIVVLQSESGRGLGTRLLRKASDSAVRLGFRTLMARTEVVNRRAIGFYKKHGFTETAKATEKVGRMKVPVQVLEKRLR